MRSQPVHRLVSLLLGVAVVGVVGLTQARATPRTAPAPSAASHEPAWLGGAHAVVTPAEPAPPPLQISPPAALWAAAAALPAPFASASAAPLDGARIGRTPLYLRTRVLLL